MRCAGKIPFSLKCYSWFLWPDRPHFKWPSYQNHTHYFPQKKPTCLVLPVWTKNKIACTFYFLLRKKPIQVHSTYFLPLDFYTSHNHTTHLHCHFHCHSHPHHFNSDHYTNNSTLPQNFPNDNHFTSHLVSYHNILFVSKRIPPFIDIHYYSFSHNLSKTLAPPKKQAKTLDFFYLILFFSSPFSFPTSCHHHLWLGLTWHSCLIPNKYAYCSQHMFPFFISCVQHIKANNLFS